jgi:hypothetical protein
MDIANIFASQGATESRVDTLEDTIKQNAAQAQAQVQQALDTTNSTKSTIEESIGGPLLGTGVNKIMRSKALRAVFKKAGTSPEELAKIAKMSDAEKVQFFKDKGVNSLKEYTDKLAAKAKDGVKNAEDLIAKGKNTVNKIAQADKEGGDAAKAVADKASVDTPEDIEQMGKDMANAKDVSDLFYNPAFDQTALGNDAERAVQSGMKTVDSYATDTARLLGADEDVATFASKANDFYQAAKSVVSSAPGAISDFASSARQGVSDLASATKGAVVDAATSAAEAAAAVLPESVTAAATTVATATTEAIGGAIASSQGFIDPITDFIGLAVGLAGVIGGAESDPDKAAEVIPKIPEVYSSYVPGV